MKPVLNIDFVDKVLEEFFQKETWTNSYMLRDEYLKHIENNVLFYDRDGSNIFLYLKKNGFYRLYYFINQADQVHTFDYDQPLVLEILYRGEKHFPQAHQEFWTKSGFQPHLSRDCYFLKNNELTLEPVENSVEVKMALNTDEIAYSKELIDSNLDIYTGDQLSLDEITQCAQKGLLYIAYLDGFPCGMLQADFKNNVFWLGHIVVDTNYRGKGIANALVYYYLKEGQHAGCKQYQLWVIQDNTAAVNLYKKFGFVYLNKSTFSMLKN